MYDLQVLCVLENTVKWSALQQWFLKGDFALGTSGKIWRHIYQSVCERGVMEPREGWGADKGPACTGRAPGPRKQPQGYNDYSSKEMIKALVEKETNL